MATSSSAPSTSSSNSQKPNTKGETPVFDHEKLDVYRLQLDFIRWVTTLLTELKQRKTSLVAEVHDQLDRASISSLLNTAEGNGKRRRQVRARFFDDARGSATECAACLDALVAKDACLEERVIDGKRMLVRIVQMLTKLVVLHDETSTFREEQSTYVTERVTFEDEGEIEDEGDQGTP